jgi:hypothetical protein
MTGTTRLSDGHRELVECCADPVAGGDVGGEFVVAAADVLHEGVPGGRDLRTDAASVRASAAAWLSAARAGLDRVAGIALAGIQR